MQTNSTSFHIYLVLLSKYGSCVILWAVGSAGHTGFFQVVITLLFSHVSFVNSFFPGSPERPRGCLTVNGNVLSTRLEVSSTTLVYNSILDTNCFDCVVFHLHLYHTESVKNLPKNPDTIFFE